MTQIKLIRLRGVPVHSARGALGQVLAQPTIGLSLPINDLQVSDGFSSCVVIHQLSQQAFCLLLEQSGQDWESD
jgi:uncharacterized membrane protein